MNRLTATNTTPVTQNVMSMVLSIVPQFDAIGVNHQGLSEVENQGADDQQDQDDCDRHRGAPLLRADPIAWRPPPPDRRERVYEMAVEPGELGFGMALLIMCRTDRTSWSRRA